MVFQDLGSLPSFFSKHPSSSVPSPSSAPHGHGLTPNIGKLPPHLTPTELVFKLHTGIDPNALEIKKGDEWFTFMDLCAKHKWRTYDINWKMATDTFNKENQLKNPYQFVPKDPHALHVTLFEVEKTVIDRLATGNFQCEYSCDPHDDHGSHLTSTTTAIRSEKTEFWTTHCHAVEIIPHKKTSEALTVS